MWSTSWHGAARRARALGALSFCALCISGSLVGCGGSEDSTDDDAATGGSGGGPSNADLGLPAGARIISSVNQPTGECMSAANCGGGAGAACATVAGSYRVCTFQPPVATTASSLPSLDKCGPSSACASGSCYATLNFGNGLCGNATPQTYNVCRADDCASDADCNGGVCGPRGFASSETVQGGAIRQCLEAACKSAADCTLQANGICALVQAGCGPGADGSRSVFLPAQLACVYPRGCTSGSDCPSDPPSYCRVVRREGVCVTL